MRSRNFYCFDSLLEAIDYTNNNGIIINDDGTFITWEEDEPENTLCKGDLWHQICSCSESHNQSSICKHVANINHIAVAMMTQANILAIYV